MESSRDYPFDNEDVNHSEKEKNGGISWRWGEGQWVWVKKWIIRRCIINYCNLLAKLQAILRNDKHFSSYFDNFISICNFFVQYQDPKCLISINFSFLPDKKSHLVVRQTFSSVLWAFMKWKTLITSLKT